MKKIELLAPAGSLQALEAAVESGADAVYMGGSKFNARAFADNLDMDMLQKAVEYAHIRGSKVYITVNILILQKELEEILEYIRYLYSIDVDAVIVQDIGLAAMIRRLLPDFEVHCSTQMAIHNSDGAAYLASMGIERVVLARELTLEEVDQIAEKTGVETEIFVHGALCVCYSGQCYMSSYIGGRSGNRGKCAQPCRKQYTLNGDKSYLISTRDLSTYSGLKEIVSSRAASLKIEGRMKRPEYVAIIVKNYRDAIDCLVQGSADCLSKEAEYEMKIAFNREFTKGYLLGDRNQNIVSSERPDNRGIFIGRVLSQKGNMVEIKLENNFLNDGDSLEIMNRNGKTAGCTVSGIKKSGETVKSAKAGDIVWIFLTDRVAAGSLVNKTIDSMLFQKAREGYAFKNKKKVLLKGSFTARVGCFPNFDVTDDIGNKVQMIGEDVIQAAEKAAATEDKIMEQLNKTGDTPYIFEKLEINIDANVFIPVKTMNNLRREALEKMDDLRTNRNKRQVDAKSMKQSLKEEGFILSGCQNTTAPELIAGVRSAETALKAIEAGADTIYILGDYRYQANRKLIEDIAEQCNVKNIGIYYVLPQITRDYEVQRFESLLAECLTSHENLGLVLSNISHLLFAKRLGVSNIRGNFSLNVMNSASANFLRHEGLEVLCTSPELNLTQIRDMAQASNVTMESIVYGYLPAMVTEYCPDSAAGSCSSCDDNCLGNYSIKDERDKEFPVIKLGNCRNLILNSDVLCVYDNLANITSSGISNLRMDFYLENEEEVYELVSAYKQKLLNPTDKMEHDIILSVKQRGFTKGHYFRGTE